MISNSYIKNLFLLVFLAGFFQSAIANKIKVVVDGVPFIITCEDKVTEKTLGGNDKSCLGNEYDTLYGAVSQANGTCLASCYDDNALDLCDCPFFWTNCHHTLNISEIKCCVCKESVTFTDLGLHARTFHPDQLINKGVTDSTETLEDHQNCPDHVHIDETQEQPISGLVPIEFNEELSRKLQKLSLENQLLKNTVCSLQEKMKTMEDQFAHPKQHKTHFVWEISEFSHIGNPECSEPFYRPNPSGYKMRLLFYPKGSKNSRKLFTEYASLYLQIMPGENDDHLQWPLSCAVRFIICHKSGSTRKCISNGFDGIPVSGGVAGLQKPKSGKNNAGFGFNRIAPCSIFKPDRGFVQDDKLTIVCHVSL